MSDLPESQFSNLATTDGDKGKGKALADGSTVLLDLATWDDAKIASTIESLRGCDLSRLTIIAGCGPDCTACRSDGDTKETRALHALQALQDFTLDGSERLRIDALHVHHPTAIEDVLLPMPFSFAHCCLTAIHATHSFMTSGISDAVPSYFIYRHPISEASDEKSGGWNRMFTIGCTTSGEEQHHGVGQIGGRLGCLTLPDKTPKDVTVIDVVSPTSFKVGTACKWHYAKLKELGLMQGPEPYVTLVSRSLGQTPAQIKAELPGVNWNQ
ncbi:uncharacterized protein MKK02DRAFT_40378 [Dioszegia hungarica]|uniref:Uncharacterized protein n=1 Tax=Dioszegia hungarica TaxID=4972 RepID=A0AA38LRX4_9TREE|nr:uncharacterized protein MKK02DRAFT_40378 [Dioszegia hungarica]KAI9632998.1 hypothetical protein MKK02DRAFT_40378 [Dioszegia hungarica]